MKIRIIGMPSGLDPNEKHGMVYESLDGDTITYRYVPPEPGQETASCTHGADCELHPQIGQQHNFDGEPYTGISLRTAPCGNQDAHRAHTYGMRDHQCLGVAKSSTLGSWMPAMPDVMAREGDRMVAQLSPDAQLVVDEATCLVLCTPERRITVTNVDEWREQLASGRTFAEIYRDEAEALRRDENQAATQMKSAHCQRMRERSTLIEHLNRSPDHGTNTAGELIRLESMSNLDLIRAHMNRHGLR